MQSHSFFSASGPYSCDEGWFVDSARGKCYFVSTELASSWEDAKDICVTKQSELMSIKSPEENEFIKGRSHEEGLKGLRPTGGNTQNHGYIYDRCKTM